MGLAARTAPTLYGRLAARELGPADGAVLCRDGFAMFARMTSEAFMAHLHYREIFDALMR